MDQDRDFINSKLKEWGLEKYAERFIQEDIDANLFLSMPKDLIEKIIPTIGGVQLFLRKRQESHQETINNLESEESGSDSSSEVEETVHHNKDESCSTQKIKTSALVQSKEASSASKSTYASQSSVPQPTKTPVQSKTTGELNKSYIFTLDLEELLKESIDGRILLSAYKKNEKFDPKQRQDLAHTIVNQLMTKLYNETVVISLDNELFDKIADKIAELFPSETKDVYYVKPKAEGPQQKISKGKLVDYHRNKIRELNACGLSLKRKRNINDDEEELNLSPEVKRACMQHLNWLKNNSAPWRSVENHWDASRPERLIMMKKMSIHDVLQEWTFLRQPLGYTLLESDYNKTIRNVSDIYTEWPTFSDQLLKVYEGEIKKHKNYVKVFEEMKLSSADDVKNTVLLTLLPLFCPPEARLKVGKTKIWRPSVVESMNGFILHVKSPADLEIEIRKRREKFAAYKQTVQPYVIVVGAQLTDIQDYYVQIEDDVLYQMENILNAVDICFKLFQVLNAKYPVDCEQVWLLLQQYVYKHNTKWDKKTKSVIYMKERLDANKQSPS